jgi:KaiC/GvpD/RAD55 family RecA-like ATPase
MEYSATPTGNGAIPSAGPRLLFDSELEREFVAALLANPSSLAIVDNVAVVDLADFHAVAAFTAIRNLQVREQPITIESVRGWLLEHEYVSANPQPKGWPMGWLDALAATPLPPEPPIAGWAFRILDFAVRRRQAIRDGDALLEEDADIDRDALADVEAEPVVKPPSIGRTWSECVDEIYARKDEPWIDLRVGTAVIATCRNGSFIPLVAPSGAGKSTLVIQMLVDHAVNRGPAIYMTYELDGDEAVARAVGQLCSFGWAAVLRGEVPRTAIPDVDRLRVLERDDATIPNLAKVVVDLRALYPDQPIFVVVDYMQATPAPPGKERGYTANVSVELRRAAKKNRVVLVGVSQASTENSKKLRAGELLGIDTSATGAETAQIERDAYVILTLSARQEVDQDTISWKLSTAKYRLGIADVVQELHYRGRIGSWEPVGAPISGTEARETQSTGKDTVKRSELRRSIVALVTGSPRPLSKRQITEASTGKGAMIADVIKELVRDGELVHVNSIGVGGGRPLWIPGRVEIEGDSDE